MNCAQHTETAAAAYCCTCGRALCELCQRDVQGTIFCESCLAARIHPGGDFGSAAGNDGGSYRPPRAPEDASPELALFLGFIPGVGAFYNGQFLKGFVHVMVLSTLIFLSDHGMRALAGLMIAAWFFYMVFDAYTTAKARRYGLPIPDPIGLNAILEGRNGTVGQRLEQAGERLGANTPYVGPNAAPRGAPNAAPNAGPGSAAHVGAQGTYYSGPEGTYYAAPGYVAPQEPERSPLGAVLLIGIGVLFLLANLGWFSIFWIRQYWPVILIATGLWLFIRRRRDAR